MLPLPKIAHEYRTQEALQLDAANVAAALMEGEQEAVHTHDFTEHVSGLIDEPATPEAMDEYHGYVQREVINRVAKLKAEVLRVTEFAPTAMREAIEKVLREVAS